LGHHYMLKRRDSAMKRKNLGVRSWHPSLFPDIQHQYWCWNGGFLRTQQELQKGQSWNPKLHQGRQLVWKGLNSLKLRRHQNCFRWRDSSSQNWCWGRKFSKISEA
jgi:hypothetical protein